MMSIVETFAGLEEIVQEDVPLSGMTWFELGGPARWLIRPRTVEELQVAATRCSENGIPIYVLGLGANVLVADEGLNAAVFRLNEEHWRTVKFENATLEAGAGVDLQKLLLRCIRQGLSGLECLAGIPGTIGGGIRGNCGGKYGDIGALVTRVSVMDSTGTVFDRLKDDLVFGYRSTNIAAPFILGATLELEEEDPDRIMRKVKEIWMFKRNSQPLSTRNAGCIFKNPRGLSAGALIDQAGLKGTRVGAAEVSAKHANFIIAHEGCCAGDIMKLIKLIQERVYDDRGVSLEPELQVWKNPC